MTRCPKDGKGSKWTIKELNAITNDWKGDALNDGDGLSGEVRTNANCEVSIAFRYGFKLQGKKVWHYCGAYPSSSLTEIQENRDGARNSVKSGVDPRAKKEANKIIEKNKVDFTIA